MGQPAAMSSARILLALLTLALAACTSTTYQSEAPARDAVQAARERIEQAEPDRSFVTFVDADALARPIFEAIAFDAARICRTVAEADDCSTPAFRITESAELNARTQFAPSALISRKSSTTVRTASPSSSPTSTHISSARTSR